MLNAYDNNKDDEAMVIKEWIGSSTSASVKLVL
jgi:hypothetical protein